MYSSAYLWAKIIHRLEEQLSPAVVSALLDDAEVVELSEDTLILSTPSDFRKETILRTCKQHIETVAAELCGTRVNVTVWDDSELRKHRNRQKRQPVWSYNPHFSFDSFIAGSSNLMPLKASMYVAEHPGDEVYNPLYIYGPPGVGKTHLLYAIANSIAKDKPDANIVYVKGDQFTNELVQAIMESGTLEFKKKYRQADVLLVDDIQFIAGKDATQEEFFHTFNDLFEFRRQIVLTSDRSPGDMPTLEDRLKGRFGEGVMVQISPPDQETRRKIIQDKAEKLCLTLDEPCIDYLSEKLCDNVRQIEGGLRKLRAYHDLSGMPLTLENVAQTILDLQTAERSTIITAELVVRYVCKYYGVEENQIKSQLRNRNISEPRQVAMFLIRHLTKMSFPSIGQYFGRDQATVQHAVKKVEAALKCKDSRVESILHDIQLAIEEGT